MLNVYYAEWCPHCKKAISFLDEKKIKFKKHDMEKVSSKIENKIIEINGGDDWIVPTFEYNGKWIPGEFFSEEKLTKKLKNVGLAI